MRPLDGRVIEGHRVSAVILPCRFGEAAVALREAIDRVQPSLVIACGEAGGRAEISLERVAINVDDARMADNAGKQPIDRTIAEDGPVAYWSTLPIKAIGRAIYARGIPVAVSETAGTFVCNHLFYALMRVLAEQPGVRGGFIHVPRAPEQEPGSKGAPTLATKTVTTAIEVAIAITLISVGAGGATS